MSLERCGLSLAEDGVEQCGAEATTRQVATDSSELQYNLRIEALTLEPPIPELVLCSRVARRSPSETPPFDSPNSGSKYPL